MTSSCLFVLSWIKYFACPNIKIASGIIQWNEQVYNDIFQSSNNVIISYPVGGEHYKHHLVRIIIKYNSVTFQLIR